MKKGVEKTDLYQLHLLSGLKASPSGNRLSPSRLLEVSLVQKEQSPL